MKKMVAWMLIAYATLLMVGEKLRSHLYPKHSRKSKVFSGAFVFPKVNPKISPQEFRRVVASVRDTFRSIVSPV
ncbi:hypothetical protein SE15_05895 [Thermanaerothrix daxensis]|uniref:Uncharacterized protein n=1 Tax=Thermanaerothrix daxensis TaxID=869279 RepID=A0A0P6XY56_9CHLR|nr:hypothetical protein [Thermanaerothrix daxensis]KPL84593.1 hypothetical protein SE15_05895 [Thermanaerothrix daxensis]